MLDIRTAQCVYLLAVEQMIRVQFLTGIFLFVSTPRPALEPKLLPIQWVPEALFPEMGQPEREADHSHSASKGLA
jgi:hypothetical protein